MKKGSCLLGCCRSGVPPHRNTAGQALTSNKECAFILRQVSPDLHKGFTLIELLVVVLIIGILAAVALPQYQKAVMQTKFTKLYNISRIYQRAAQEYIVASGKWPSSFDDLSIDAPAGFTLKTPLYSACVENQEFYCCIKQAKHLFQNGGITCGLSDYSLAYEYQYRSDEEEYGGNLLDRHFCLAKQTDSIANRICAKYSRDKTSTNVLTPTGYQWGYDQYGMPNI